MMTCRTWDEIPEDFWSESFGSEERVRAWAEDPSGQLHKFRLEWQDLVRGNDPAGHQSGHHFKYRHFLESVEDLADRASREAAAKVKAHFRSVPFSALVLASVALAVLYIQGSGYFFAYVCICALLIGLGTWAEDLADAMDLEDEPEGTRKKLESLGMVKDFFFRAVQGHNSPNLGNYQSTFI